MVVMTAKVSKAKMIAVVCILAAIICIALLLLSSDDSSQSPENGVSNSDVNTNESRVAYLAAHGWEVDPQPVETQEVMIPEEMNDVFEKYNELQRSQGFDLTRFAGKKVKRYVYSVTNYEGASEPVYATLLIHDGTVIGGDITSTAGNGLMHGFSKPAGTSQTAAPATENSAEQKAAEPSEETAEPVEEPAV